MLQKKKLLKSCGTVAEVNLMDYLYLEGAAISVSCIYLYVIFKTRNRGTGNRKR